MENESYMLKTECDRRHADMERICTLQHKEIDEFKQDTKKSTEKLNEKMDNNNKIGIAILVGIIVELALRIIK